MRIAMGVQYFGTNYHGWQRQADLISIQQVIEQSLSQVADHEVEVVCAGRTDAGVHAVEQVIHFDTHSDREMIAWLRGCNRYLPDDISILWACPVSSEFSARYTALSRSYRYIVFNHTERTALLHHSTTLVWHSLDHEKMLKAGLVLLGENDFSSFRSIECQSHSPMRNLTKLTINRQGAFIFFDFEANAFLHHMVRNIVGTLLEVGMGRQPIEWVKEVLDARDRTLAGPTAKPSGLYLRRVEYPVAFDLPQLKEDNTPFIALG